MGALTRRLSRLGTNVDQITDFMPKHIIIVVIHLNWGIGLHAAEEALIRVSHLGLLSFPSQTRTYVVM